MSASSSQRSASEPNDGTRLSLAVNMRHKAMRKSWRAGASVAGIFLFVLVWPSFARPGGAPAGFSGAPGLPDCRSCHQAGPNPPPSDPVELRAPLALLPGEVVTLEIALPLSAAAAHGFALALRDRAGQAVGALQDTTTARAHPGNLSATHRRPLGPAPRFAVDLSTAASALWAPGPLTLHAATLTANGDGLPTGDATRLTTTRIFRGRLSASNPVQPGQRTTLSLQVPHRPFDPYLLWLAFSDATGRVDPRLGPLPLGQVPEVAWLPLFDLEAAGITSNFFGGLGPAGRASATIDWPANLTGTGLRIWIAGATIDPVFGRLSEYLNPIALDLP